MTLDSRLRRDGFVMLVPYEDLLFFPVLVLRKKKVNRTLVISKAFLGGCDNLLSQG